MSRKVSICLHFSIFQQKLTYCRKNLQTKENVAIKVIDLEASAEELDDIQREIRFLSECKSEWTVEYFGSFLKGHQLHIVMEYVGGGSIYEQATKASLLVLTHSLLVELLEKIILV